jgi:FkbM family methyltransferase
MLKKILKWCVPHGIYLMYKKHEQINSLLTLDQVKVLSGFCDDDVRLISKFADPNAVPRDRYYTDFTGIKTSPKALETLRDRCGTVNHNLPFPNDTFHAWFSEYASLFYAVEKTINRQGREASIFTMFELGAGWGPWMAYTAKACKTLGFSQINIIGIEGEENKIPLIKEHLFVNGFRQDNDELSQNYNNVYSSIIHGVITDDDKDIDFPVVDTYDYGASMLKMKKDRNHKKISIRGYSLKTLLNDFEIVDFIHIDIQGHEVDVIKSAISILKQKVRYICIGTHSHKIEGDLIDLMFENDWELLRESPCIFNKEKTKDQHLVDLTTIDGTQLWRNNRKIH